MEKLKGIGINNFKSFDEEGIFIDDLSKINIFIGKNNSGKSNIFNIFSFLKKALPHRRGPFVDTPNIEEICNHSDRHISKEDKISNKKIQIQISIMAKAIIDQYPSFNNEFMKEKLITFLLNLSPLKIENDYLNKFSDEQLLKLQDRYSSAPRPVLVEEINKNVQISIRDFLSNYIEKIIFIPQFREIEKNRSNNSLDKEEENTFDGKDIIKRLKCMQHPDVDKIYEQGNFIELQNIISDFFGQKIKLEITHNDKILITHDGKILPLKALGTGIHELIIISAAIVTNPDSIFCIEEPEIHMHPELQRKFLEFIKTRENNQFFITTHSNVFIDNSEDTSVYHVTHDGSSSKIDKIEFKSQGYKILDDLGYKASDILQTNFIIWVEGPSDRIYLKKWIECYCNDKGIETFKEGLHYSFLFYGGSNLSYFSIFNEDYENPNNFDEEFINILSNCRNAIVICDSDKSSSKKHLKPRIKKLEDRITKLKEENDETNKHIMIMITDGREIENYIPHDLLLKVLSSDGFKKKYFLKPRKIEIICTPEKISDIFSKYDKFNDFFSNMYFYKNNRKLNPAKKGEIANYYNQKKVEIAREVAKKWEFEYFSDELKEKIEIIFKKICNANGLKNHE